MPRQPRTASRAALAALLLALLCLAPARAAPARQADATPTAAATPTASPALTATPPPTASPALTATPPPPTITAPSATPAGAPATPAAAPAQSVRLEISKRLVGSDVVQVGQYLTFTIQITNSGGAVVTDLPLVDEFDPAVLQPAPGRTTPPPTASGAGVLRWADLTDSFGDLDPGRSVTVTAVFRAVRIVDEVINRARIETGLGTGGGGGAPVEDEAGGAVEGGSVTVTKALVEGFINLDTPVISFTLSLRNDGYTDIVRAPLVDTYRADLLRFVGASVPPDAHDPAMGELRWDDLLAGLGVARLRPQETVSFTTAFSVTGPIEDAVVNSFDAVDVLDEFGNRVASPRRAEVRIRIAGPGAATATATPAPEEEEERRPRRTATPTASATAPAAESPTPAAPAAPTPTGAPADATPAPAAEATADAAAGGAAPAVPAALPATGAAGTPAAPWVVALLGVAAGLALRAAARGRGRP